jgi:hypothetical protein
VVLESIFNKGFSHRLHFVARTFYFRLLGTQQRFARYYLVARQRKEKAEVSSASVIAMLIQLLI